MSFLLEQLLSPACRRECEANDAADKEMDMRHHSESFRTLSREQVLDQPADEREYRYTILRHGQPEEAYSGVFASSVQAHQGAIAKAGPGGVVVPMQQEVHAS